MLRKRIDLVSVGGVGMFGMFLSDAYSGGGDCCRSMPSCGILGASLDGGGGASREGSGGAVDGTVTSSVRRDDDRLIAPGLLLSSFMRFVERVLRNCVVRSAAQLSGSGCAVGRGTGFRLGMPPLGCWLGSAMVKEVEYIGVA